VRSGCSAPGLCLRCLGGAATPTDPGTVLVLASRQLCRRRIIEGDGKKKMCLIWWPDGPAAPLGVLMFDGLGLIRLVQENQTRGLHPLAGPWLALDGGCKPKHTKVIIQERNKITTSSTCKCIRLVINYKNARALLRASRIKIKSL
jgi:hypothetical protein